MKLYLIRHGQSQANVNEEIYLKTKDHNIELTDIGQEQALAAGKNLFKELTNTKGKTFVIVSPYTRTRQTWEGVKSQLCPVSGLLEEESPLIREQEYKIFSDIEDMKLKKNRRSLFGPFWYRYKNAESTSDVLERITVFWNQLTNRFLLGEITEKDNVVIVAHEVVIRMFLMILKKTKYEDSKIDISNCEIQVLDLKRMAMVDHKRLMINKTESK